MISLVPDDRDNLRVSQESLIPMGAILECQENPEMPILGKDRLSERLESKKESGAEISLVTFACLPKMELRRSPEGTLIFVPNIRTEVRASFEIKSKKLATYEVAFAQRIGTPAVNTVMLADVEPLVISRCLGIPITDESGRELVPESIETLMVNYAARFSRKTNSNERFVRSSEKLPLEFYLSNPNWPRYFNYFKLRNSEINFSDRLQARMKVFFDLGEDEVSAKEKGLVWLAAMDTQYALEAEYLAQENAVDAMLIIDSTPLFQAEKHIVGSGNRMSYIFPLAKNEQG